MCTSRTSRTFDPVGNRTGKRWAWGKWAKSAKPGSPEMSVARIEPSAAKVNAN
jgi:hypothetical protein